MVSWLIALFILTSFVIDTVCLVMELKDKEDHKVEFVVVVGLALCYFFAFLLMVV